MVPAGAPAKGDAWFLTISTAIEGDALVWRVAGRLGTAGAAALQEAQNASAIAGRRLVLDLCGVDYVSGAGVLAIAGLANAARESGGSLELVNLAEPVRISLDLARLGDVPLPPPDAPAAS